MYVKPIILYIYLYISMKATLQKPFKELEKQVGKLRMRPSTIVKQIFLFLKIYIYILYLHPHFINHFIINHVPYTRIQFEIISSR